MVLSAYNEVVLQPATPKATGEDWVALLKHGGPPRLPCPVPNSKWSFSYSDLFQSTAKRQSETEIISYSFACLTVESRGSPLVGESICGHSVKCGTQIKGRDKNMLGPIHGLQSPCRVSSSYGFDCWPLLSKAILLWWLNCLQNGWKLWKHNWLKKLEEGGDHNDCQRSVVGSVRLRALALEQGLDRCHFEFVRHLFGLKNGIDQSSQCWSKQVRAMFENRHRKSIRAQCRSVILTL